MKILSMFVWFFGLLLSPLFAGEVSQGFHDLAFDKALKKAAAENKIVFVDFYATWCGPCKLMDRTTFQDKKVVEWFGKNAVALKIDAEQQTDLASRYAVNAFPNLVFIKNNGELFDRAIGYLETEDFLAFSNGVLTGKNSVERARQALDQNQDDPALHVPLARALANHLKYEEAWQEYEKSFTRSLEMGKNRTSEFRALLEEMSGMTQMYPQAIENLGKRTDKIRFALLRGKGSVVEASMYAAINQILGQPENTYLLLEQTQDKEQVGAEVRKLLIEESLPYLAEQQNYSAIAELIDFNAELENNTFTLEQGGIYYATLLGLQRNQEAAKFAEKLLARDENADTYYWLAQQALNAGVSDETNLNYARRANELTQGKKGEVVFLLASMLAAQGKSEEAKRIAEEGLQNADSDFGKFLLERFLKQ